MQPSLEELRDRYNNHKEVVETKSFIWSALIGTGCSMFSWPYVVMRMWKWFVVPFGIHQIGYWHAFGLIGLASVPIIGTFVRVNAISWNTESQVVFAWGSFWCAWFTLLIYHFVSLGV